MGLDNKEADKAYKNNISYFVGYLENLHKVVESKIRTTKNHELLTEINKLIAVAQGTPRYYEIKGTVAKLKKSIAKDFITDIKKIKGGLKELRKIESLEKEIDENIEEVAKDEFEKMDDLRKELESPKEKTIDALKKFVNKNKKIIENIISKTEKNKEKIYTKENICIDYIRKLLKKIDDYISDEDKETLNQRQAFLLNEMSLLVDEKNKIGIQLAEVNFTELKNNYKELSDTVFNKDNNNSEKLDKAKEIIPKIIEDLKKVVQLEEEIIKMVKKGMGEAEEIFQLTKEIDQSYHRKR